MPELIQKMIEEQFACSLQSLDKVKVAEEKKAELRQFAMRMLGRKY